MTIPHPTDHVLSKLRLKAPKGWYLPWKLFLFCVYVDLVWISPPSSFIVFYIRTLPKSLTHGTLDFCSSLSSERSLLGSDILVDDFHLFYRSISSASRSFPYSKTSAFAQIDRLVSFWLYAYLSGNLTVWPFLGFSVLLYFCTIMFTSSGRALDLSSRHSITVWKRKRDKIKDNVFAIIN